MADNQVVLGIFADEAAADAAVESLKVWDKASDDVKLGAIGVLVVDDKGALKTHKMGQRSTKKGAGIGLVLAIVAPPTLLAGVVGGGVLGSFHHKGLRLTDEDSARIGNGTGRWQGRRRRPCADRRGWRPSLGSSPNSVAMWKPTTSPMRPLRRWPRLSRHPRLLSRSPDRPRETVAPGPRLYSGR